MITLGQATIDDAEAVTGVINRAYEVEAFFKVGGRTDVAEIRDFMTRDTFLVFRNEGRIIGTVRVSSHDYEGHFGMLAVEPALKGGGLGRRLVDAAEEWCQARGCTSINLEVVNLREELPPWYRRLGYEVTGTQPWPADSLEEITRECHFIIMSKELAAVPAGDEKR